MMSKENTFPRNGGSGFVGHGRRNYLKDEELIVRRRNAESDRQQLWSGVNDYFKTWDVRVNKFSNWASPLYYNHVYDARTAGIEVQAKLENLEKRREKLTNLMTKEATEYKEEMKDMRKHNQLSETDNNLCYMNLEFMRRADQVTKRENELKLYHHYTFPHPDKFHDQYAYFSRKAANEDKKETCNSKLFGLNNKLDSVITNEKTIADKKIIQSHIMALQTEINHQIKKLDELENKKNILKSKENKRNEQISQIKSRFNELVKEDETDDSVKDDGKCDEEEKIKELPSSCFSLSSSAGYLLLWREKSKSVQDELKQQIRFLDSVIEVADGVKEFMFKYQVEKMKNLFFKKLQIESGREKLSKLFECTSQEPSMWWKEENKMWIIDEDERKKHLKHVFSKLETMEEKWNLNNLEEQKCILENQESIVAELEKCKKDVENNENLLK